MVIRSDDIVPLNKLRASFTALAEEVRAGREKIITRNGESYVALVDARQLDRYHQLESAQLHLTLLNDAAVGLRDVQAGRTASLTDFRRRYRRRK